MASPTMDASTPNDENMPLAAVKPITPLPDAAPDRRVLGHISPNVKTAVPPTVGMSSQPTVGSPLKRGFAAMETGQGFMYLKKRKLSVDGAFGEIGESWEQSETDEARASNNGFRPLFRAAGDDGNTVIPTIAEPSPTEPNTPSEEGESATQGSSAERKSFSSLINYDPSSQTSIFKSISNAEMLRLQLRVAMYKVRTNQVEVPFVDLVNRGFSRAIPAIDATAAAVKEAVDQLRKEALEVAERQRLVLDRHHPSSPPNPKRSPDRPSAVALVSALGTGVAAPALETSIFTPPRGTMELQSPPTSYRRTARSREVEVELTSSVVKGRVAEGLLGLRHAI